MTGQTAPRSRKPTDSLEGPGRRVVTGFDAQGKSTIALDGPVPKTATGHRRGELTARAVWSIPPGPPDLRDQTDPMASFSVEQDWFPPPGGMTVAIVTYEPGFQYPMHRTQTLDVGFIISGRLELILESGSTVLGPGECYVQCGTAHSWRVVGDESCTFCGISVGATRHSEESAE